MVQKKPEDESPGLIIYCLWPFAVKSVCLMRATSRMRSPDGEEEPRS